MDASSPMTRTLAAPVTTGVTVVTEVLPLLVVPKCAMLSNVVNAIAVVVANSATKVVEMQELSPASTVVVVIAMVVTEVCAMLSNVVNVIAVMVVGSLTPLVLVVNAQLVVAKCAIVSKRVNALMEMIAVSLTFWKPTKLTLMYL